MDITLEEERREEKKVHLFSSSLRNRGKREGGKKEKEALLLNTYVGRGDKLGAFLLCSGGGSISPRGEKGGRVPLSGLRSKKEGEGSSLPLFHGRGEEKREGTAFITGNFGEKVPLPLQDKGKKRGNIVRL